MGPGVRAEPIAPGRGLPVSQPGTVLEDGTCMAPPWARPSVIRLDCTPMTGMVSETGLATAACWPDPRGATIGPVDARNAPTPLTTPFPPPPRPQRAHRATHMPPLPPP